MTARIRSSNQRYGGSMIMIVLLMSILIGMVAFAVDVGRMYLVRSQLQTAVDSGALAATYHLIENPNDVNGAVDFANEFVQHNRVGTIVTIPENAITVEVGTWDSVNGTFAPGGAVPDSVRVSADVADEPLLFASVFGHTNYGLVRAAIANGGGSPQDIMMTLDLSGSMGTGGRIEALRDAAPEFVYVIEDVGDNDRIGVMGYGALPGQYDPVARGHSGVPYLNAPSSQYPPDSDWVGILEAALTTDFNALRTNVLNTSTLTHNRYNGWTPTGAALRDSAHYLDTNARSGVNKVIVLMSDGLANKPSNGGPQYARNMAQYAASLGIRVYTISLGNAADQDLMEDIATITGGEHYIATGSSGELPDSLTDAFRNVANSIKRTQLVQ